MKPALKKQMLYGLAMAGVAVLTFNLTSDIAHASDPTFTTLGNNVRKLAGDIGTIITGGAAATTTAKVGWHAWMKSLADGETSAIAEHNRKMKNTIVWGGGITIIGAIATALMKYLGAGIS